MRRGSACGAAAAVAVWVLAGCAAVPAGDTAAVVPAGVGAVPPEQTRAALAPACIASLTWLGRPC